MTTTEQALAGARRLAALAAQRRAGLAACPYPAGGTPVQSACRRAWLRTYLYWRPDEVPPIDWDDDLTALAHGPDSRAGEEPDSPEAAVDMATLIPPQALD